MGLLKDLLMIGGDIITLGGRSRLEEAKLAYSNVYGEYLALYNKANAHKTEIEENITAIGSSLTHAKYHLGMAEKVIKRCVHDKNGLNIQSVKLTLNKVDKFNSSFNTALNVGAGSIAGSSLAVGSWAIVTAFGSASTGTAISLLSGAAATNATMAWFGGGALAAGGAGMSGGMAVLGGVFAIPLVYIAAKGAHKKAKGIEDAKAKVEDAISNILDQMEELPITLETIKVKRHEISQICTVLISDTKKFTKIVRPNGIFSLIKQGIILLFGRNPYTEEQEVALNQLNLSISKFLSEFRIGDISESTGGGIWQ